MVIDRLPNYALTSEFGNIELSSVSEYVDIELSFQNKIVLKERYLPDLHGKVSIMGIGELANDLIKTPELKNENFHTSSNYISFGLKIGDKSGAPESSIIYMRPALVDTGGQINTDLYDKIPLTVTNEKRTGIGRIEFAPFSVKEFTYCYAYIVYRSEEGDKSKEVTLDTSPFSITGIYTFDVSPARIAERIAIAEQDLVYYNIYVNKEYVIKYTMSLQPYPHLRTFAFINSFFGQEAFTAFEAGYKQTKWDRRIGTIRGKQRQFRPKIHEIFFVNTGWLHRSEVTILEDMLQSQRVGVLEGSEFVDVIIDTDSIKVTEKRDELISIEFSYTYADDQYRKHKFSKRKIGNIFDASFDNTFE